MNFSYTQIDEPVTFRVSGNSKFPFLCLVSVIITASMSNTEIQRLALQWFPSVLGAVSIIIAGVSAIAAIKTYRKNARTKEAEFIYQLHRAFFVDGTYSEVREDIDDHAESATATVDRLVLTESGEFTDFLNFFELTAYFESCGTLSSEAVEAILGYYLNLFEGNPSLRDYVKNPDKGFEYLDRYLGKR